MSSSACFSACEYDRRTHQAAGGRRALSATLPSVRRDDASTYLIRLWVVRVANDEHMFDMLDPSSRTVSIVEHPQLGPMPNGTIHSQPTITARNRISHRRWTLCYVGAKHVVISSPEQLWTVLSATRRLAPNDHSSHLVGVPRARRLCAHAASSEPIEHTAAHAALLCSDTMRHWLGLRSQVLAVLCTAITVRGVDGNQHWTVAMPCCVALATAARIPMRSGLCSC